ncbi:hypothetical protein [Arthrobacter sp. ZGTC412]|uniref:hypothetical protein n=1 Tax=Arthrobacter sp. ZGTC412 TaxID=2058900 RepID=UPI000CE38F2E|nr:hypothetical protein [Arthrobacter sp. ZGTC412]
MSHVSTLRALATGVAVILALITTPSPAFAKFTDTKQASTLITTGLATPATANVTMECNHLLLGIFGWNNVVTVNSFGKVPRATSYEIRIFDGGGQLQAQGDTMNLTIWSERKPAAGWRYELRAKYTVPTNPTNVWTGNAIPGTLKCDR